jgi:hypothetical protein
MIPFLDELIPSTSLWEFKLGRFIFTSFFSLVTNHPTTISGLCNKGDLYEQGSFVNLKLYWELMWTLWIRQKKKKISYFVVTYIISLIFALLVEILATNSCNAFGKWSDSKKCSNSGWANKCHNVSETNSCHSWYEIYSINFLDFGKSSHKSDIS